MSYTLYGRNIVAVVSMLFSLHLSAADKIGDTNPSPQGDARSSVKIIEPKKDVPVAKSASIDDERFELGIYTGILSVEDFNSNPVVGLSFSYHVTPLFMLQLQYGRSEVDKAAFEEDNNFLSDSDRDFEYKHLLAGYRVLRGRSFWGKNSKYNSDIYLLGGVGSVDFAGESNTSVVFGASYRVVVTDAVVVNMDFRSHLADRDFLDDDKRTLNTEFGVGINLLF